MANFNDGLSEWSVVNEDALLASTMRSLPTGVVTFLLSDVAGSTRLWEADEEATAVAIARHYELLGAAIVLHGGVLPVGGLRSRPAGAGAGPRLRRRHRRLRHRLPERNRGAHRRVRRR